jgi:3-deoxy-D-manno-octulosonic-acid transferase
MSLALGLYRVASRLAAPVARSLLRDRARRGKEDPARIAERMGAPGRARPDGPLIWLHGASVGEGLAALAVAERLIAARPDVWALLTTGTVTSAELLGRRLGPKMIHQYAPLDVAPWVRRFLAHWSPDVAARVDSELWPETLMAARARGPVALVNGRISARSAARWGRVAGMARRLMGAFDLVLAQDGDSAARFMALGARAARVGGALKASSPPPEADPAALRALRAALAGRPVWLAASTHPGEESIALAAHRAAGIPGLLTIVAPRHPARGGEVAALSAAEGLRAAVRSAGAGPEGADVYVADTLGEMGLWYRLAPFALIGGSVVDLGGHNPYEPAALGVALAHGGHVANFADAYAALEGCARRVTDAPGLADAIRWAVAPGGGPTEAGAAAGQAALAALAPDPAPLDRAAEALLALLERR